MRPNLLREQRVLAQMQMRVEREGEVEPAVDEEGNITTSLFEPQPFFVENRIGRSRVAVLNRDAGARPERVFELCEAIWPRPVRDQEKFEGQGLPSPRPSPPRGEGGGGGGDRGFGGH